MKYECQSTRSQLISAKSKNAAELKSDGGPKDLQWTKGKKHVHAEPLKSWFHSAHGWHFLETVKSIIAMCIKKNRQCAQFYDVQFIETVQQCVFCLFSFLINWRFCAALGRWKSIYALQCAATTKTDFSQWTSREKSQLYCGTANKYRAMMDRVRVNKKRRF